MLKITVNPDSESVEYQFDKPNITVGDGSSKEVDVALFGESLQKVHLKFLSEKEKYYVVNIASDPFCSLNGLPFGKKLLQPGDKLQVGRSTIRIDEISDSVPAAPPPTPEEPAEPPEAPVSISEEEPLPEEPPPSLPAMEPEAQEEEQEEPVEVTETVEVPTLAPKSPHRSWTILVSILVLLLTLGSFSAGVFYFRLQDKIAAEQKDVEGAVADLAMALTHAKIQRITPSKMNWSDPDFLHNNLMHVLSPKHRSFAKLNLEGQLKDYPYLIRIYTELNLKQFVIIAQPIPNMSQRIFYRPAIVLDSQAMEVRRIQDLRTLNRLLAKPNPLDETTGPEVSNVIRTGQLTPLAEISDLSSGFAIPKTHRLIRPNAASYVYNAPRYYPFGEDLMRKAVALKENTRNSYEVSLLQYEINAYAQYSDIILYTTKGMQQALEAQKALADFAPHANFLVATLSINQKGEFTNSRLLMNEKMDDLAYLSTLQTSGIEEIQSSQTPNPDAMLKIHFNSLTRQQINPNHPLYLRLSALAAERKKTVKEFRDEVIPLIQRHTHEYFPDFLAQLQTQIMRYEQVDNEIQARMSRGMKNLYNEYTCMPLSEFVAYVKASGLEGYFQDYITQRKMRLGDSFVNQDEIHELFRRVQKSRNLLELERHVAASAEVLTLDSLPDIDQLIEYQNKLRSLALQRVARLLFSPESPIYYAPPQPANRLALSHILKTAWVTDANEYSYFFNEYDNIFEELPDEGTEEEWGAPFYT